MRFSCAAALLVLAAGLTSAQAEPFESAYTKHDWQSCKEAKSPEPDVIEVRACDGFSGIDVRWIGEPDSSWVEFDTAPLDEEMGIAPFFEAGNTVEWRGPKVDGKISPEAAIVRYRVGTRVGRLESTRLVAYRLEPGGKSCIMAILDSTPGVNGKARRLVDAAAPAFVCGTSARTKP